jgi:ketosteroid isomerase-like protein
MSRQNPEIVRTPLRLDQGSRRAPDERFAVRFPRLAAVNALRISKLPPGSRIRQAALSRTARLSMQAYNRRDLDAVVIGWQPDFEYRPDRAWVEAGLVEACYRGLQEYRKYVATVDEVWGRNNYLEPGELIDLGGRIVVLAEGRMRAQASGVPLTEAYAAVCELTDGRAIRIQEYYDHGQALEAVGLQE